MCAEQVPRQTRRPTEAGRFGEALRRAREARGLSLEDVVRNTRIAAHHLDALERSDLDALPAGPFGRAYIRSYAEVLGIDPGPILEAHHAQEVRRDLGTPERDERMLKELSRLVGRGEHGSGRLARLRSRPLGMALAALAVVIAGVGAWLLVRNGTRDGRARTLPAAPVAAPRPTPVPPAIERSAPARPDRLTPTPGTHVTPPRPHPAERPAAPTPAPGSGPPTNPQASKLRTDALEIAAFGVGSDVVAHRLVGRADRFPEGTRVFFWTLVAGGQPGQVVHHVWFQGGRAVMRAELSIGGPHWRTRSSLVLPDGSAGPWTVEARTSDGRLLARNDFVCERRPR